MKMITIISLVGVAEMPYGSGAVVAMVYIVAFFKERIKTVLQSIMKVERMNFTAQIAKQLFRLCFLLHLPGGTTKCILNDGLSRTA